MVFQSYALFPHLSVRANARFGLEMRKIDAKTADARVADLATGMGLADLLDRSPHALSGGQQQRVALLRALVTEPRVLLFDEPLSNLDARLRVAMRAEIRRIQKRAHITAIYVTHDQEEAMVLSDRIVVMEHGRIAQVGPPRDVYARPNNRFVASFLGDANFLDAEVVDEAGDRLRVDTVLGRFEIAKDREASAKKRTLVVRPESLRLAAKDAPGPKATIRAVAFLGAEIRYEVALGASSFFARTLAQEGPPFGEGDEVTLTADPTALHAIADT
jgi:ABC-type Fe3+/spermidine/putrescine transport system ATPase subunit